MNRSDFEIAKNFDRQHEDLLFLLECIKAENHTLDVKSIIISVIVERDNTIQTFTQKLIDINDVAYRKVLHALECSKNILDNKFKKL